MIPSLANTRRVDRPGSWRRPCSECGIKYWLDRLRRSGEPDQWGSARRMRAIQVAYTRTHVLRICLGAVGFVWFWVDEIAEWVRVGGDGLLE